MAHSVKAVLFDLDGTLLDTEPLSDLAMESVLRRFNDAHRMTWEIKRQILGMKGKDWGPLVLRHFGLESQLTVDEIVAGWEHDFKTRYATARVLPGVHRLTEHLHRHNVPMAICTSSNGHTVKLKYHASPPLFDRFGDRIIAGDDPRVARGKPHPDIFLAGASLLGVDPSECLVVEDAHSGYCAGVAAGMKVVVVPDVRLERTLFQDAHAVLKSLDEFVPEHFSLPPYPSTT